MDGHGTRTTQPAAKADHCCIGTTTTSAVPAGTHDSVSTIHFSSPPLLVSLQHCCSTRTLRQTRAHHLSPAAMSYDPEHFTTQANKAVQAALELARERGHIELHPLHLAYVLFSNESSLAAQLAQRAGVTVQRVLAALEDGLRRLSRQDPPPSDLYPNPAFVKVLKKAAAISKEKKDSHTSVDSLLLALFDDTDTRLCLDRVGLTRRRMEELVQASRGNQGPVTSASAENTYDALKKFAMDLVAMAEDGKLDPVIGRDAEIRRCIQVLSRRTKNNPVLIGEPGVSPRSNTHCGILTAPSRATIAPSACIRRRLL